MEQRLIDANAIKLEKGFFEKIDNVPKFYEWLGKQPTVDAVPVVRCEKCKHRGFHRALNCIGDVMTDFPENSKCPMQATLLIMPDDFYCKYGERKESAE